MVHRTGATLIIKSEVIVFGKLIIQTGSIQYCKELATKTMPYIEMNFFVTPTA